MGEFRSLKIISIMACAIFGFVWAWISIAKLEMYIPDAKLVSGLMTLVGGRLIQSYTETKTKGKE
jgi:hypothetical protein